MQVVSKDKDIQRLREYAGYVREAVDVVEHGPQAEEVLRSALNNLADAVDRLTVGEHNREPIDGYRMEGEISLPIEVVISDTDERLVLQTHDGETDVTRLLMSVAYIDPDVRQQLEDNIDDATYDRAVGLRREEIG